MFYKIFTYTVGGSPNMTMGVDWDVKQQIKQTNISQCVISVAILFSQ